MLIIRPVQRPSGVFRSSVSYVLFLPSSLKDLVEEDKTETDAFPFQRRLCVDGRIKELSLNVGQRRIICSFTVVGEEDGTQVFTTQ